MTKRIEIDTFIKAIEQLPADRPVLDPDVWYRTQKEHWLGWLGEYHTSGAYGRATTTRRDARFAYNHVVNYQMLEWLIRAGGLAPEIVAAAKNAMCGKQRLQEKAAAIRRVVPWELVAATLWPSIHS